MQSADAARKLAPVYLVHEICQRSALQAASQLSADDAAAGTLQSSAFLDAAATFLESILECVLPSSADDNCKLVDRIEPLVVKWEQKELFAAPVLDSARQQLRAARAFAKRSSSRGNGGDAAGGGNAAGSGSGGSPMSPSQILLLASPVGEASVLRPQP